MRNTTLVVAGIPLQLLSVALLVLPWVRPLLLPGVQQEGAVTGAEVLRALLISVAVILAGRPC